MTLYKFLAPGARGPLSGFVWPVPPNGGPSEWVDVEGRLEVGLRGLHACREGDLAYWLHDELWELETRGERMDGIDCLVVRHGRLARRIDAWAAGGAARFVNACIEHARELAGTTPGAVVSGLLDDAVSAAKHGYVAIGAYSAALGVARIDGAVELRNAFRRERTWQSRWIARELIRSDG